MLIILSTDPITPGVPSRGSLVRPKNQAVSQVFRLSSEQKVFLDDFEGDLELVPLKGDKKMIGTFRDELEDSFFQI